MLTAILWTAAAWLTPTLLIGLWIAADLWLADDEPEHEGSQREWLDSETPLYDQLATEHLAADLADDVKVAEWLSGGAR